MPGLVGGTVAELWVLGEQIDGKDDGPEDPSGSAWD
jgi:hypothetical protein